MLPLKYPHKKSPSALALGQWAAYFIRFPYPYFGRHLISSFGSVLVHLWKKVHSNYSACIFLAEQPNTFCGYIQRILFGRFFCEISYRRILLPKHVCFDGLLLSLQISEPSYVISFWCSDDFLVSVHFNQCKSVLESYQNRDVDTQCDFRLTAVESEASNKLLSFINCSHVWFCQNLPYQFYYIVNSWSDSYVERRNGCLQTIVFAFFNVVCLLVKVNFSNVTIIFFVNKFIYI